jgi:hypothetical protein
MAGRSFNRKTQRSAQCADNTSTLTANHMTTRLLITAFALLLAGCEIPGMGPDPRVAQREADAKAIGSACRHGLRSIEDCYTLNDKAPKAAVFTGWKEMDEYMRENKIEGVPSTIAKPAPAPAEEIIETAPASAKSNSKPTAKVSAK